MLCFNHLTNLYSVWCCAPGRQCRNKSTGERTSVGTNKRAYQDGWRLRSLKSGQKVWCCPECLKAIRKDNLMAIKLGLKPAYVFLDDTGTEGI